MLLTLDIENYQAHKNSHFDFHSGVNVIVGASDSGKSSIIRALRLLRWNKPAGKAYASWWGGNTLVQATTSDDHTVSRKEGEERSYNLNDLPPFKAFRNEVPIEVQNALNLDDLNLQMQKDSFFLFHNTSGEVAGHFNKIAHLDKIDTAQSNIKRWCLEKNQIVAHKESDLEKSRLELKTFEYLETFEIEVEALEELDKQYTFQERQYDFLEKLLDKITTVNNKLAAFKNVAGMGKDIDELLELINKKRELTAKAESLNDLIATFEENVEHNTIIQKIKPAGVLIDSLLELIKKQSELKLSHKRLFTLCSTIKDVNSDLEIVKEEHTTLHAQYESEYPEICPFCGSKPKKK